ASHGQAGAVERVYELDLALLVAEARLHAPRLESLEVAARGDLAIRALPRQPDLDIVGLGRGESHVSGAQRHGAERQFQAFQDRLGVTGQLLQALVRVFLADDL